MNELQSILFANALILIVPGVNFSVIVRNALLYGIGSANWTAIGITVAIMVHVLLGLFSLNILLYTYPMVFDVIKYMGCAYISFLGIQYLWTILRHPAANKEVDQIASKKAGFNNFKTGFMIDILNPFVSIFYISIFSPVLANGISATDLAICVVCIACLTLGWFLTVGTFFSKNRIRNLMLHYQGWIQGTSGIAMFYFAYRLFVSKL